MEINGTQQAAKVTGIPAWVASVRRSRTQCERCGQAATAEVTFTGTSRRKRSTELVCARCWDAEEAAQRASR